MTTIEKAVSVAGTTPFLQHSPEFIAHWKWDAIQTFHTSYLIYTFI
jgi:hypothetical protein